MNYRHRIGYYILDGVPLLHNIARLSVYFRWKRVYTLSTALAELYIGYAEYLAGEKV